MSLKPQLNELPELMFPLINFFNYKFVFKIIRFVVYLKISNYRSPYTSHDTQNQRKLIRQDKFSVDFVNFNF